MKYSTTIGLIIASRIRRLLLIAVLAAATHTAAHAQSLATGERKLAEKEARKVIDRFTKGKIKVTLECTLDKLPNGNDTFIYEVSNGILTVKASSGVALCRGFYEFIKSQQAGINSWSGSRFKAPTIKNLPEVKRISPYRDHQYMNVVTYGYTCPYWDKKRWDEEIDWMALHGIDMPLMLIAQEAIYRMVFKDMGLTDAEIDEWEVGPAHLPWMRMGNLAGNSFDGPLGEDWNKNQLKLAKHVINRMRRLNMKPVFPAFGGFVPPAFTKRHGGKSEATGWDWVPDSLRNNRLTPNSKAFVEIGRRFIQKWESIFGKGQYYLSDSFNEMEIPQDKQLMTQYGDSIYKSIKSANPNATWVMMKNKSFNMKDELTEKMHSEFTVSEETDQKHRAGCVWGVAGFDAPKKKVEQWAKEYGVQYGTCIRWKSYWKSLHNKK